MKRLLIVAVLVLLLAMALGVATAYAQVEEALPGELSDLLAPTGLGVAVMVTLGLLKRLNSERHGSVGKLGDWLNSGSLNQFFASVVIAGIVLGVVQLIIYLGAYEVAQGFWANFVIAWTVSQGAYNLQKAGATGVKALRD
jgi:ABC-type glycerol-3-phosphate transport system permease component